MDRVCRSLQPVALRKTVFSARACRAFTRQARDIALTVMLALASVTSGVESKPVVSEIQLNAAEVKYGPEARKRLNAWLALIATSKQKTDQEKVERVNAFFNQLQFVSDQQHWGRNDYWATPIEMLASGGGDCEDYSISKYFTLLALGVAIDKLKITYVKALKPNPVSQAHMVLTYFASPSAIPVVLDNLDGEIKPADQRPDLLPIYSFNGDGLWLAKERGLGKRVETGNRQKRWHEMLDRMGKEL